MVINWMLAYKWGNTVFKLIFCSTCTPQNALKIKKNHFWTKFARFPFFKYWFRHRLLSTGTFYFIITYICFITGHFRWFFNARGKSTFKPRNQELFSAESTLFLCKFLGGLKLCSSTIWCVDSPPSSSLPFFGFSAGELLVDRFDCSSPSEKDNVLVKWK